MRRFRRNGRAYDSYICCPYLLGTQAAKWCMVVRGGVVGATATMGVVVGADIPMFLGGYDHGAAWRLGQCKKIDDVLEDRIPVGFEMLINNFSAGILGVHFSFARQCD